MIHDLQALQFSLSPGHKSKSATTLARNPREQVALKKGMKAEG
jgi:hypothetical protein